MAPLLKEATDQVLINNMSLFRQLHVFAGDLQNNKRTAAEEGRTKLIQLFYTGRLLGELQPCDA